jgi:hypothetical protein
MEIDEADAYCHVDEADCSLKACHKCIWLRQYIKFIRKALDVKAKLESTKIYRDNAACVPNPTRVYQERSNEAHQSEALLHA